ncbi:hypothetical protein SAMN05444064_105266 [Pseudomonas syringae]|uniref:hypothetical protein n=1 Tax=Pseudomonas syringae TaxID=317 RepID=UPI000897F930|nr:hypothetical protein [Pseudomonas syringae]SDW65539.1 hypothetical protein SAMN05444514_105256 [Pseudomonas syringae]SDW65796.1 hypothetical protein SAMN05444514_105266 [Pseudomonas syringae]SFL88085.1 hypothetical protein SAMN05444064_105256 [Pseudomonas syringae]SFL88329.1 hypothetical protein SAMN05444064_105266 [Pseudomonas syringae]
MARFGGVWRVLGGGLLLCCFLPAVEAATKSVTLPSISEQVLKGTPAVTDGRLIFSTAIEGEFIPAPTKNVPVRGILGGTSFGMNTIKGAAKGLIRGGVPALLTGAAMTGIMTGLDWVMKDGAVVKRGSGAPGPITNLPAQYGWRSSQAGGNDIVFGASSASESCTVMAAQMFPVPGTARVLGVYGFTAQCEWTNRDNPLNTVQWNTSRAGGGCPANSSYESSTGACISDQPQAAPLTDTDLGLMDNFVDAQNSDFVKNLLKEACQGSNNPNGCYQSLRDQSPKNDNLTGPKTVDGGTVTKTSTTANSDGTTSQTVTNTTTTYNMSYSPSTYTYTQSSKSSVVKNGVPIETTTEEEQPSDEAPPEETPEDDPQEDIAASPCVGEKCDGPVYKKLYEKSKDTKESKLDSYASRVAAIPLFAAVTGYFTVTASAGCPVWEAPVNFSVFQSNFNTDLVFDFHCQSWFTSISSYASIVMMIVCSFLAFRQAFLD